MGAPRSVNLGKNVSRTYKILQLPVEQDHLLHTACASDYSCTTLNIAEGPESVVGLLAVRMADRESSATGSNAHVYGEEQLYGTTSPE